MKNLMKRHTGKKESSIRAQCNEAVLMQVANENEQENSASSRQLSRRNEYSTNNSNTNYNYNLEDLHSIKLADQKMHKDIRTAITSIYNANSHNPQRRNMLLERALKELNECLDLARALLDKQKKLQQQEELKQQRGSVKSSRNSREYCVPTITKLSVCSCFACCFVFYVGVYL